MSRVKSQSEANRSYHPPAADDERELKSIKLIFGRGVVKEVFISRSRLDLGISSKLLVRKTSKALNIVINVT